MVAERRSGDTPVREVMTSRAETVPPDTMVGEVLLRMLEGGFHHFPIAAADGSVLGVVTDTDLMGIGRDTPFALKSSIERAPDREAVATAVGELPRVVSTLVSASADPVDVGHVIAFSIDAATRRLLELGMAEHGEPSFPWAWLALGSAARQEQAIRTDQDHALAFEGDPDAAERVVGPARRVRHRRARGRRDLPLHGQRDGDERRAPPLPAAVGRAVRVLDEPASRRRRANSCRSSSTSAGSPGPLEADVALDRVMATAPQRPLFLQHLARRALDVRPPIGFVRGITVEQRGEHPGKVDIKHGGIVIVGNLARAYAIRAGLTAKRTIERLRASEQAGAIDAETREGLEEAFRFLWEIRLRHHVDQIAAGEPPDDFVDPKELGGVARQGLKEAFHIIARAQKGLAVEAGVALR